MTEDLTNAGGPGEGSMGDWTVTSAGQESKTPNEYRLIRRLGEGGFGEVWLAEQEGALHRAVAIKFFKTGMHAEEAVSRFHAERRLLAALDHSSIATIFDAGTTPEGRPFFVMEFIDGLPLSEYCWQRKVSLRQCVRLGIEVCDAVQHAHQRTVLHRDLKPANVLVREDAGGQPEVKVIDFGIGKALGDELLERTLWTLQGEVLGTPDYMSPEQAAGDPSKVDVRTDIFAIGAMLYELFTGGTPLQALRRQHPACQHAITLSKHYELPSLAAARRLFLAPETQTSASQARVVAESLDRDLEAVVMKACEVEMERRYATVAELAEDLRRWVELRPVQARAQTTVYRVGKFIRRQPALALGALALAVVLGGWTGTGYHLANRAELARQEALRERDEAEARRLEAEAAQKAAQQAQAEANATADMLRQAQAEANATADMLRQAQAKSNVTADMLRQAQAESNATADMLQQAQAEASATADMLLKALSNPTSNFRGLQTTVVEVLDDASRQVREDKRLSTSLRAFLLHRVGMVQFHYQRYQEALISLEEALRLRRLALGPGHEHTLQTGLLVAQCHLWSSPHGRIRGQRLHEDLLRQAEQSLGRTHPVTNEAREHLGFCCLYYSREPQRAVDLFRENLDIRQKLHGPEHALTLETKANLSACPSYTRGYKKAVEILESALPKLLLQSPPSSPYHVSIPRRLGYSYYRIGRFADALKQTDYALASAYRLYGPLHSQTAMTLGQKLRFLTDLRQSENLLEACGDYAARVEKDLGLSSPEQRHALPIAIDQWCQFLQPAGHDALVQHLKMLATRVASANSGQSTPPPAESPKQDAPLRLDLTNGSFAGCRPGQSEREVLDQLKEHGITEFSRGQPEPNGMYRLKLPQYPCMDLTFRSDQLLLRIHWTNREPTVVLPEGLEASTLTRQTLEAHFGKGQPQKTNDQGLPMAMILMGSYEIWFDYNPAKGDLVQACAIRTRIWDLPGKP